MAAGAFKLFFSSAFPSQFHSLPSMQIRLRVLCELPLPGISDRRRGHARLSLRLRAAWQAAQSTQRLAFTSNGLIA